MEARLNQKNRWKTQRCLNCTSWNSNHSVRWTDDLKNTFVGWVLWPKDSKQTVGWTGIGSGSSDALGFGNSKGQGLASSAPDDPMPWPAVYPTAAFKTYRDAPKLLLQHWMDRRLEVDSLVHPTAVFKTYSTAPSGCSSAPDGPTGRQCIASVYLLGYLVQRLYWILWVIGWSDACAGGYHRFIRLCYFFRKPFPMASLPC
jgi:hypothetical protein